MVTMVLHLTRLPIHFILLLCYGSSRSATFAFAPPSSLCRNGKANIISSHKQLAIMPSLRVRGGGATSPAKIFSSAIDIDHDDGEKNTKLAYEAIRAIQYCCKMCFAAVFADLFVTFIDDGFWSKFSAPAASFTWVDYFDIFDSTSLLIFGAGLWRISKLYFATLSNMDKRMEPEKLLEIFRTMGRIWGVSALNLALVSISMAASLPVHGSNGPFQFLWDIFSSTKLSLAVVGILAIGRFFILGNCDKNIEVQLQAYEEMMAKNGGEFKPTENQATIREAGYGAYCNQAQCAGAFAMLASLTLVKWIVSFDGNIIGHLFAISDVLTPFALSVLLFTLNKALLRAAIAEVRGDHKTADNDDGIYSDLFVAQAGFYNKVAETLKGATIFGLLPYVAGPIVPYVLKVLKEINIFAKAFEALGIQV